MIWTLSYIANRNGWINYEVSNIYNPNGIIVTKITTPWPVTAREEYAHKVR